MRIKFCSYIGVIKAVLQLSQASRGGLTFAEGRVAHGCLAVIFSRQFSTKSRTERDTGRGFG